MPARLSPAWRVLLFAGGALMIAGAMTHPRDDTMTQMLANPSWTPSHAMMLGGYVALLATLLLLSRAGAGPGRPWMPIALAGTAIQTIEAALHLAAVMDAEHMATGHATPVFNAHMMAGAVGYPLFGLCMIVFVVAGARTKSLGSWWIAPLGILGAALPALAAILVIWLGMGVGVLFAGILFFGLWAIIVSLSRVRVPALASPASSPRGPQTVGAA